jgi:hypothetical protein
MLNFARWMMLGVSVYAAYFLARFYVAAPQALWEVSGVGLSRIAFVCFLCVAIVLLSRAIFKDWRRGISSGANRQPVVATNNEQQGRREHPLMTAFKSHPVLTSLHVLALTCTLFLLQVVSHPERSIFDPINLGWLVAGLILLAIGIAILRRKVRTKGESRLP